MIKKLIFLMSIVVLNGFSDNYYDAEDKALNRAIHTFMVAAAQKYNLSCHGTQASFPKKVESMGAIFGTDRLLSVDESRVLILQLVKDYQELIDRNTEIRSFLADYPFSADRINIAITMRDGNKRPAADAMCHVFTALDKIIYSTSDSNKSIFDQTEYEEPIEEACAKTGIVLMPMRSSYSKNAPPFVHTELPKGW